MVGPQGTSGLYEVGNDVGDSQVGHDLGRSLDGDDPRLDALLLEVLPGDVGEGGGHADTVLEVGDILVIALLGDDDAEAAVSEVQVLHEDQVGACLGGYILSGDSEVDGSGVDEHGDVLRTYEHNFQVKVGDLDVETPAPGGTETDACLGEEFDCPFVEPALVGNGHFYRHFIVCAYVRPY